VFTVLHAELFTLTYKDKTGEAYEIKVSGEHPFWVADKGWVSARQLAINDRLEITDNTYVAVTGLTSEPAKLGETFTTYNFEVDDFHTYFVLQEGKTNGAFAVLVHNAIPCGPVGGVYGLYDKKTGELVRSGRTNNLARREKEHLRYYKNKYRFEPIHKTDSYSTQRGLEQMVHEKFNPRLNKIRGIDKNNPKFRRYMAAANKFLERLDN